MERRCGWAEEREEARWENATDGAATTPEGGEGGKEAAEERCKTQVGEGTEGTGQREETDQLGRRGRD